MKQLGTVILLADSMLILCCFVLGKSTICGQKAPATSRRRFFHFSRAKKSGVMVSASPRTHCPNVCANVGIGTYNVLGVHLVSNVDAGLKHIYKGLYACKLFYGKNFIWLFIWFFMVKILYGYV